MHSNLEQSRFNISTCPVCGSLDIEFSHYLTVPDWLVSKENFELQQCAECSFVFTSNAPSQETAGPYYESEEYVEHTDTKKGLIYGVYHQARKLMLKFKLSTIKNFNRGNKILDIGSGSGYFINFMKQNGYDVSGVEISEKAVALCKEKFNIIFIVIEIRLRIYPQIFCINWCFIFFYILFTTHQFKFEVFSIPVEFRDEFQINNPVFY